MSRSDAELAAVVAAVRVRAADKTLEADCAIGRIVFEHLYHGDVATARGHGRKVVSLRRFAARFGGDARLESSRLSRCVAIDLALRDLGPLSRWAHVKSAHVRWVLGLPQSERARLLAGAEEGRWSSRRLGCAVRDSAGREFAAHRAAEALLTAILRHDKDHGPSGPIPAGVRHLRTLHHRKVEETYCAALRVRDRLDVLLRELNRHRLRGRARRR